MNSKQKEEFRKVVLELDKYNLNEHVSLSIGDAENDKGKKTKHIFAYWLDTVPKKFSRLGHRRNKQWYEREVCKSEEMSKFSSREEKVAYLKAVPYGHPALFQVWLESNKELDRVAPIV